VFRSDLIAKFRLDPTAFQEIIDRLDDTLKFVVHHEINGMISKQKLDVQDPDSIVLNYDAVFNEIKRQLEDLRDTPNRNEFPSIYHLDVSAMYPNIMLTNRLQPTALVDESTCATCDFNTPDATCQRVMKWKWRGEYFPSSEKEFEQLRNQLEGESMLCLVLLFFFFSDDISTSEQFPPKFFGGPPRTWQELNLVEQSAQLHKRVGDYSRKVYKRTKVSKLVDRESTVCQRENSFYLDVVRNFRDRFVNIVYLLVFSILKKTLAFQPIHLQGEKQGCQEKARDRTAVGQP